MSTQPVALTKHCYNFFKHCYNYKTLLQCFKNHCNYYEAGFWCLTSILNGKCWTNAFRMLVESLLHDFLPDVEKSYNDIVVYLERARSHPTGKMWVETTIYPTCLAMKLVRAERETDWLLRQDRLWRMLPLLFAAGHHWYARYTIAFLLEMQNLPAAAKSDIMSGAPVCRHSDGCESVSAE